MKLTSPSRRTQRLKLLVRARIHRIQAPTLNVDDYVDSDNTMVEYNSNDMFDDLLQVAHHRYLCY
jgi:hypothetical protein